MDAGNGRIAKSRERQREAMDRLLAEIRAREEATEVEDTETGAEPVSHGRTESQGDTRAPIAQREPRRI